MGNTRVKMVRCCICGKMIDSRESNEAWPVKNDGRCCFECNMDTVVPARLNMLSPKSRMHRQETTGIGTSKD